MLVPVLVIDDSDVLELVLSLFDVTVDWLFELYWLTLAV